MHVVFILLSQSYTIEVHKNTSKQINKQKEHIVLVVIKSTDIYANKNMYL